MRFLRRLRPAVPPRQARAAVAEIAPGDLTRMFVAPRWLRGLGRIAWLLVGTLAVALIAAVLGFLFTLVGGLGSGRRYYGGLPGGYGGWGGGGFGGGGFGGGGGGFSGGGGSFGGGGASGRW